MITERLIHAHYQVSMYQKICLAAETKKKSARQISEKHFLRAFCIKSELKNQ
jgi:hypothetical protein